MVPRLRRLAALLALVALSLSSGGSAWAAMCAAEADRGHAHGHHDSAPAPDPGNQPEDSGAPACPFLALGGSPGSCLGSFLGADAVRAPSPDRELHLFARPADPRDLLAAHPPFRPPEA